MIVDRRDLVTQDQGATLARVARPTLRLHVAEGRIGAERIAGHLFVMRDDCLRLAAERAARAKRKAALAK